MALTMRMGRMEVGQPPPSEIEDEASTIARRPRASSVLAQPVPPVTRRCPSCEQVFSGEALFCPFDGDALVDAPNWNPALDPMIGRVVDGRYEVATIIGEGGMGTVYEVKHVTLGRKFALKVLRRDIADAEHTARFIQEAKAAAAIGHPNIVGVSDFGELELPRRGPNGGALESGVVGSPTHVPYFVMEHLAGTSLAAILRSGEPLSLPRVVDIFTQATAGLAAAHAAGVVHRDLKPDNVFLTTISDREFVKLLDFGVAKMAGTGRLTQAGIVFGTPHYMSPEQAEGQSVDARTDIYAVGVMLYESLSGHVPFEADTYMGVLKKHMFDPPLLLDRAVPGESADQLAALRDITMRCLAKSPGDRFASMTELGLALEAAREAQGETDSSRARRLGESSRIGSSSAGSGFSGPREDPLSTPGLRPALGPVAYAIGAIALVAIVAGVVIARTASSADVPATTLGATSAPATTATAAADSTAAGSTQPSAALATATAATSAPVRVIPTAGPRPAAVTGPKPKRPRRGGGDVVDPWKN